MESFKNGSKEYTFQTSLNDDVLVESSAIGSSKLNPLSYGGDDADEFDDSMLIVAKRSLSRA